jgi:hypothetical protein
VLPAGEARLTVATDVTGKHPATTVLVPLGVLDRLGDHVAGRRVHIRTSSSDDEAFEVGELRAAALSALVAQPSELTIDLQDVEADAVAISALHDVRDAARARHCRLVVALPRLTIHLE